MSPDNGAAIGAVAFWLFIAIIVVANVVGSVFRNRETQKTIRHAIERGQALDPQTLDRLLTAGRPPRQTPRAMRGGLLFGGIMLLAIGAGLAAIGWFSAQTNPAMLDQGLGAGAMVGCLGVGLLVVMLFIRDPRGNEQE